MIITFTKTMHTYIVGQPKHLAIAQRKKVNSFIYSFITDLSTDKTDWSGAVSVISECLLGAFHCSNVRDMEISCDIASGQYSVRFTSDTNLKNPAYAATVTERDGELFAEELELEEAP